MARKRRRDLEDLAPSDIDIDSDSDPIQNSETEFGQGGVHSSADEYMSSDVSVLIINAYIVII